MATACPLGGLTSFPLEIGFEVSKEIYDNLPKDAQVIQVQWGARTTPPKFMKGPMDGGRIDETNGMTTIRYNTNVYTLTTLQICKATHSRWILPVDEQANNTEDIVFIFESTADIKNKVIMIVVPILRKDGVDNNPSYLSSLKKDSNGTYSLENCLPFTGNYIKYMSCIQGYSDQAPVSNIVVFTYTNGIKVSKELMASIQSDGGFISGFPKVVSHFMEKFTGSKSVSTADIGILVSITSPFTKYIEPNEKGARDNLADYQCMPLDMAQIDVTKMSGAKPLKDVLLIGGEETRMLNPGTIEKVVSIVLGVIMGIMFVGLGIYMVMQTIGIFKVDKPTVGPLGVSGPAAPSMLSNLYAAWPFIFVGVIGIAIGAVITIVVGKE